MKYIINKKSEEIEKTSYWLSIGDLMASILIVFILLFVYKILETQETKDINQKSIKEYKKETKRVNNVLREKEKIIEELTTVKNKIIAKLKSEFEKEDMKIDIDPITGDIKLDEKILFDYGKAKLKRAGKNYLKIFIPKYVDILLGDENIKKEVAQIIVEGHTDDKGDYLHNLNLSQQRAFAVLWFIYKNMKGFRNKELLKKYITANGKSETQLIIDENGNINRKKSRRVVFKFRLKNEETIKKIKNEIKGEIK